MIRNKLVVLTLMAIMAIGCSHDVKSLRYLIRGANHAVKSIEEKPITQVDREDAGLINLHKVPDSLGYKYYHAQFLLPADTVGYHLRCLQILPPKLKLSYLPTTYLIRVIYIPTRDSKFYLLYISSDSTRYEPLK